MGVKGYSRKKSKRENKKKVKKNTIQTIEYLTIKRRPRELETRILVLAVVHHGGGNRVRLGIPYISPLPRQFFINQQFTTSRLPPFPKRITFAPLK